MADCHAVHVGHVSTFDPKLYEEGGGWVMVLTLNPIMSQPVSTGSYLLKS